MEEDQENKALTLAEARELDFEFGLDTIAAKELQGEVDAAQLIVLELSDGMVTLGYPADGGPIDQTIAGKALLVITGLQADRGGLRGEIEELRTELAAAIARAEKAEGSEKRAKASLTKATTPAKPRKLGDMDNALVSDRSNVSDVDQMKLAIAEADEVQIAFSDGTREVPGLQPVNVAGDAWRQHQFGLMLTETVELAGPDGGTSVTIDGYALLLDGKQVAYCRRSAPLQVAPGQRVNIVDDIIF